MIFYDKEISLSDTNVLWHVLILVIITMASVMYLLYLITFLFSWLGAFYFESICEYISVDKVFTLKERQSFFIYNLGQKNCKWNSLKYPFYLVTIWEFSRVFFASRIWTSSSSPFHYNYITITSHVCFIYIYIYACICVHITMFLGQKFSLLTLT